MMSLSRTTLEKLSQVAKPQHQTIEELLAKTKAFENDVHKRPTTTNWFDSDQEGILDCASHSYPLIHESVLPLFEDFLEWKKNNRKSKEEQEVYRPEVDILDLVNRIITKRPLMFMGKNDKHVLRDGKRGAGAWDLVGTGQTRKGKKGDETAPASLRDYMSYDEIKLAALLQVSTPVMPINDGERRNCAEVTENHVQDAIYVGAVGARMTRPAFMECQETAVTKKHSVCENGYGVEGKDSILTTFAKFYGKQHLPSFQECEAKTPEGVMKIRQLRSLHDSPQMLS